MAGEDSSFRGLPLVDLLTAPPPESSADPLLGHLRHHAAGHAEDLRLLHAHPHILPGGLLFFLLHTHGKPGRRHFDRCCKILT